MLGLRGLVAASPVTAPRCRGRCSAATAATSAPEKTAGHVGRLPLAIVPAAAASLSLVLWSSPVHAGIMSGFKGMESVPGPDLPRVEFLEKWNG
ncbi:Os03g0210700 [Oryza sativa Japonica Group]|uniref:Os03g0210700 protein n=1 Tax=Oryza sativa subsp. japonica TaxID=39947 RepID=A0A0P0VUL4_ORYSJ|nr:hypothetical protein EE612_016054 [Oryza sativa]BAS82910.1 Os03g0210700 [Oryza sativa Japonica Group]